jgi:cell division protein FtsL
MSELTSEILQEQLSKLATKQDIQELASTVKAGFDAVSVEFIEVKNDIKDVQNRLGRVERKVDKAFIDGLDRHEKWIKQIANKIGVTLEA